MQQAVPSKNDRYVFIDALRGIAALAVVIDHAFSQRWLFKSTTQGIYGVISDIAVYGAAGVQIFFVISGFVIAHSLRSTPRTARALGNFIFRRQLRLDPPYWVAITLVMLLAAAQKLLPLIRNPDPLPTIPNLLANAFYLHEILGRPAVLDVAWTLCIEIQFYLFFIFVLGLTARRRLAEGVGSATWIAISLTGLSSLAFNPAPSDISPWMIHYWWYFAAGSLAYWSTVRLIPSWAFPAYVVPFLLYAVVVPKSAGMLVGITTAFMLYLLGRAGKLKSTWAHPVIQYFGATSYSLYLVHLPVISLICRGGFKVTGDTRLSASIWFAVSILVSIVVAHVFYLVVERPSMSLAARFKHEHNSSAPSGFADSTPSQPPPALSPPDSPR